MEISKRMLAENEAGPAPSVESFLPPASSGSRWAFINGWKVEPQSNDRVPMLGEVSIVTASPAAMRSGTRRKRQAMFKEWSQSRHD
jgi:hypothetical protein